MQGLTHSCRVPKWPFLKHSKVKIIVFSKEEHTYTRLHCTIFFKPTKTQVIKRGETKRDTYSFSVSQEYQVSFSEPLDSQYFIIPWDALNQLENFYGIHGIPAILDPECQLD